MAQIPQINNPITAKNYNYSSRPHRVTLAVEPGSLRGNEGLLDQAALGAPPGTEIEQPGDKSQ